MITQPATWSATHPVARVDPPDVARLGERAAALEALTVWVDAHQHAAHVPCTRAPHAGDLAQRGAPGGDENSGPAHGGVSGRRAHASIGLTSNAHTADPVGVAVSLKAVGQCPCAETRSGQSGLWFTEASQDQIQLGVQRRGPLVKLGVQRINLPVHAHDQFVQRVDVGPLLTDLPLYVWRGHPWMLADEPEHAVRAAPVSPVLRIFLPPVRLLETTGEGLGPVVGGGRRGW